MSTYVMSDIHGQYDLFCKMMVKIGFSKEDTLYILGDVVDRGPDGCLLLSEIFQSENIKLILGNNEAMMLDCLLKQFVNVIEFASSVEYALWMQNGGEPTFRDFFSYTKDFQTEVINWLSNQPVVIPNVRVGEKLFYLTHAHHGVKWYNKTMTRNDLLKREMDYLMWNRGYERGLFPICPLQETTVIFGHTPTKYFYPNHERKIWKSESERYINIDCGCSDVKNPTLGCLRLDDMKEFYIAL